MSDHKRRYIDELLDGIREARKFGTYGGPVSISLETAKRLLTLYDSGFTAGEYSRAMREEIPEPKP